MNNIHKIIIYYSGALGSTPESLVKSKNWKEQDYDYVIDKTGFIHNGKLEPVKTPLEINTSNNIISIAMKGSLNKSGPSTLQLSILNLLLKHIYLICGKLPIELYSKYSPYENCIREKLLLDKIKKNLENTYIQYSDITEDTPHKKHIENLLSKGIANGYCDNTFRPDDPLTRAEACVMISSLLRYLDK